MMKVEDIKRGKIDCIIHVLRNKPIITRHQLFIVYTLFINILVWDKKDTISLIFSLFYLKLQHIALSITYLIFSRFQIDFTDKSSHKKWHHMKQECEASSQSLSCFDGVQSRLLRRVFAIWLMAVYVLLSGNACRKSRPSSKLAARSGSSGTEPTDTEPVSMCLDIKGCEVQWGSFFYLITTNNYNFIINVL